MKIKIIDKEIKLIIDDKEYDLHYSFRIYIIFEAITGHNLDFEHLSTTNLFILFYSAILATLQYHKIDNSILFEDMLDLVDENGGDFLMSVFATWFIAQMKKQAELMQQNENTTDKKKS